MEHRRTSTSMPLVVDAVAEVTIATVTRSQRLPKRRRLAEANLLRRK